jgi:Ca-activated chloride channel family protein
MSFVYSNYFLVIIVIAVLLSLIILKQEKSFFKWVEDHWFYKRSAASSLSSILFIFGFILLMVALLDLRGPEKNIQGKISDQKTILLIDSSASMLAEDVRPNRFKKALLLAKHFIKKAVGQQLSIVVFSDSAKQIMPFTNDIDLLEARLGALERMKLNRGGTSLTLAIKESIQFFQNNSKEVSGNILIFTDAEETDGGIDTEIPDSITLGIVGVGTAKGSTIPMRTDKGAFVGNKKFKGETVITKLDEKFIKSLGSKVKDFRYWIATSYSLPTEEIMSFFTKLHRIKQSKNNFRIRPVLTNYLLIPAMILIFLSILLKMRRSFILPLLFFTIGFGQVNAQEKDAPPKEKSKTVLRLEQKFTDGRITFNEKRALASQLLHEGFIEEANALYKEITTDKIDKKNLIDNFNKGAAQFKNKDINGGFETYKKLHDYLEDNDPKSDLLPTVKKNMLKALEQMAQDKAKKDKEDKEDKKNKENDDEKKKDQKDKDSKSDDKKKDGKKGQDKNDQDKKNNDKKENKDKKNKDEKDSDQKKDPDKKSDQDKKDKKKGKPNENGGKPGDKKKIPAILKQLMSDDNQLQKKMIDTGTTKRKSREVKDW